MQVEAIIDDAIEKKYPEPIVIVLAKEKNGKVNPITLRCCMFTSFMPPRVVISMGKNWHSLEVILKAKEFVLSFPSELQAESALLFGTKSGKYMDKLAASGIRTLPAKRINCLLIEDAVANFECRLSGKLRTGDHVILVGEIIAAHVNPEAPGRLFTIDEDFNLSGVRVKTKAAKK